MEFLPVRRAILSVTDKSGLVDFARFLAAGGVELVSTGGTFSVLRDAALPVIPVSEVTGFPEILNGRVKTLHPKIHGGILADKDNPDHLTALAEQGIVPFDLVCVNLYNFSRALCDGLEPRKAIEEIDIGGPCLLRAAAKNYHSLLVAPGISHYARIQEHLAASGMRASLSLRRELAAAAFAATAAYDGMIAAYLSAQ